MFGKRTTNGVKVGIWCDYHITLEECEGIGVFAHSLARGLATLESGPKVIMAIKAGDELVMRNTLRIGGGRIEVRAVRPLPWWKRLWRRASERTRRVFAKIERHASKRLQGAEGMQVAAGLASLGGSGSLSQCSESSERGKIAGLCVLSLDVGRVVWRRVHRYVLRELKKAMQCALGRVDRVCRSFEAHEVEERQKIIDECHVWLIPYVGLPQVISGPTVVVVHDLVCYHFPNMLDPAALKVFKDLAETVSERSTIVACMSRFIRDNDLYGVLRLPENKVRVVRPASPTNFPCQGDPVKAPSQFPWATKKYLFYPAAFREYKNHERLVETMVVLRERGYRDLHLVFTGIHATPAHIKQAISEYGLESCVHVLGKVDRDVLGLLYQKALATIVPSLYEQGSFPLMEAMYWGCPIACSNIPSLVELLECLEDSVPFFDPRVTREVADAIERIVARRDEILTRQQSYRQQVFGRSWSDAARDWYEVLLEAIERHQEERDANPGAIGKAA